MRHLLYLMFRCDVDVMESLELGGVFLGTKHSLGRAAEVDVMVHPHCTISQPNRFGINFLGTVGLGSFFAFQ